MNVVNILRGFTDCLTFPFSKIYKKTFYHYGAQMHIYLKRAHQVLDNTNKQFELLSNLPHKGLYVSFDFLQWPPRSSSVAGQYYTIIDYGCIGYDVIVTREYQYLPRRHPRSILIFSYELHIIFNAPIVNNCFII